MHDNETFVSTHEAALILERAPDTVRLLARRGRLAIAITTRAGRLYRRRDVEELAEQLHAEANGASTPRGPLRNRG